MDAWHGADANLSAADWAGTHKPVFTTAATLLATMGDTSLRNATQQQATSAHREISAQQRAASGRQDVLAHPELVLS
jgi:hypothetical protein